MSLALGSRLGVYEIQSLLGEGGMGEVYRARDTRLGRDVALKILPEAFASDSERLARFEREARTLAALNHPHIAQIHGFEESGSTRALVMELVEGTDLAERLRAGPIVIDEALSIARQIAEAVEAAHELGIIHRDLKPANIKVRPDGTVKVLDFGLAKAIAGPESGTASTSGGPGSMLANSPTITSPAMTAQGIILGTAAYMAPEQAKGKAVDKRVDVWAFGCVLYEMLTARRPFAGADVSDTLAFVLTKDVDWTALPPGTPPGVRSLLRHCLQKNLKDRLRDIGDARLLLAEAGTVADAVGAPLGVQRRSSVLPWIVAAAAGIAAIALATRLWRAPAPAAQATASFAIAPRAAGETLSHAVLARDGSFVVFQGDRLYVRRIAEFEARPIPATEGANDPFLSPDDRWLGFFAEGKIKRVALAGGDPIVIGDADQDAPGAAWVTADRILFTPAWAGSPLVSVSPDGGSITAASTLDAAQRERGHWWPEPLPDGRHVLFTIWYAGAGLSESRIGVLDLETGRHRALFPGAFARYAAGHVLYLHAGVYQVARFDADTQTMVGEPRRVLADALALEPAGSNNKTIAVAANGTIAYVAGELHPEATVSWLSRDGRREDTHLTIRQSDFALAPDGIRLAYARSAGGASQISVVDLSSRREQRLQSAGYNFAPVWHPDGRRIGFISMRKGDFDVYLESLSGEPAAALLNDEIDEELIGWLPGGDKFVVRIWDATGSNALFLHDAVSKNRTRLVAGSFEVGHVRVSPDGRWLALCANPSGSWQVYVRAVAAEGAMQPVGTCTSEGARGLEWSHASPQLVFARGDELVSLSYSDRNGQFILQQEQVVAPLGRDSRFFGVSGDGQRYLIGTRVRPDAPGIRVVLGGLQAILADSIKPGG